MNTMIAICLMAAVSVAAAASTGSLYTDRYDSVNLHEILANKRLLTPYIKCVLDQGKCTSDGKELKSHIREALENNCAKCTTAQRDGTRLVLGHLINHEGDYWRQLTDKYDKNRKYVTKYENELRAVKA